MEDLRGVVDGLSTRFRTLGGLRLGASDCSGPGMRCKGNMESQIISHFSFGLHHLKDVTV